MPVLEFGLFSPNIVAIPDSIHFFWSCNLNTGTYCPISIKRAQNWVQLTHDIAARHRAVVLAILRNGLFIALRLYISSRWVVAEKSIQKI